VKVKEGDAQVCVCLLLQDLVQSCGHRALEFVCVFITAGP
jgi:hypothetical protein